MNLDTFTTPQRQSVQHLGGPLLISAGAGSGKTFTLTQRIAWALLPGSGKSGNAFLNSIDEALVITFTEKAAGEIKERVRSTLRSEGLFDEALKVDAAWISTIHGMCNRILREHALEIGLDPAFEVLSTTQEEELRSMAIEAVLAHTNENDEAYQQLFDQLGANNVKNALDGILQKARTLPAGLKAVDFGPSGTPISVLARSTLELAERPPEGGTERFYEAAASLANELYTALEDGGTAEQLGEVNLSLAPYSCKAGGELKTAVQALRQALAVTPYHESVQVLVDLARAVENEYQRTLTRIGKVDMSGLIRTTLTAFDEHPEIAAYYTERFHLIMVDEFQDTSQLQVNMIERIAGQDCKQLCTVGDAQQSIYRFQGADVAVYLQHKHTMRERGATLVQLDDNFRSHADILAFVRAVCGQPDYFAEEFLDLNAASEGKPYLGKEARVEIALAVHCARRKNNPILVSDARWAEARHLAQRFDELHTAGHAYSEMVILLGRMSHAQDYAMALRERGLPCVVTGGSRYFESRHIKTCMALLATLANPYDANCLLTVLTSDVLPVSTDDLLFLSTKLHGLGASNEQLRRQNLAQGLLFDSDALHNASPLLEHARTVLNRAWAKLGKTRPAQLFQETVIESGWLARLETGGATEQAIAADVLKFIRLIEDVQDEPGFDMARVLREMRNRSLVAGEKPGALSVENLDAIRIMTIHASKGLEFPIVAVADCFENSGRGGKIETLSQNGTLYLSLAASGSKGDFTFGGTNIEQVREPSEFRAAIINTNSEREYEEKKRLFYVAATRASAALIVAMCVPQDSKGVYPQLVEEIKTGLLPNEDDFPEGEAAIEYGGSTPLHFIRLAVEPSEESKVQDSHPKHIKVPILDELTPLVLHPVSARSGFFSYSSLAKAEKHTQAKQDLPCIPKSNLLESDRQHLSELDSLTERDNALETGFFDQSFPGLDAANDTTRPVSLTSAADADKATDFGSALHRVCEWLALQSSAPDESAIEAALARAAHEFNVQDQERLRRAFTRWRRSNVRAWSNTFDVQQPELPFVVKKDGGIMEGEIDLFCSSGTTAGIVDYKTGGHPDETPEQLYEKHLLQAQCYAYAALQAGYKQVELRFVRVEQQDPNDPDQPQVVCYTFMA